MEINSNTAGENGLTHKLAVQKTDDSRRKAINILGETTLAKLLNAHSYVQISSGCRIWTGAKTKNGYGVMKVAIPVSGKPRLVRLLVHFVAWRIWKGEIPSGHGLCHSPELCKSRACFNVLHLRPCTRKQNEADKREETL